MPVNAVPTNNCLAEEFERLGERSPWMARFSIDGQVYGSGLNHDQDVRPPHFFKHVTHRRRILELGSCQGGGTFQLAKNPDVNEIVAIEGRAYNIEKAELVKKVLDIPNVNFIPGDLESFDFTPLGRFDAVYCVGVLYHLPRPWELLAKLATLTDTLYINTHFCPSNQIGLTLHGYEGKKWLEFGYEDPLSGMSSWSFWPTLKSLTTMLQDAGFVPEILETNTLGAGQSPHGATILARQKSAMTKGTQQILLDKMRQVLAHLSPSAGSAPPVKVSWLRGTLSRLKRLAKMNWRC
jgi:2-polyprenyl-3-methyl-5-hydroxy-6-metoxy-1,4-benzoquinol methylase